MSLFSPLRLHTCFSLFRQLLSSLFDLLLGVLLSGLMCRFHSLNVCLLHFLSLFRGRCCGCRCRDIRRETFQDLQHIGWNLAFRRKHAHVIGLTVCWSELLLWPRIGWAPDKRKPRAVCPHERKVVEAARRGQKDETLVPACGSGGHDALRVLSQFCSRRHKLQ